MLIQFIDSVAGANFDYRCGQKVDLREDIAREFIRARLAVPVEDDIETATAGPVERAVRRVRRAVRR